MGGRTIFVTRDLGPDDPWRAALEAAGLAVRARSLLRFEAEAPGPLPDCDWIFAYSRNAVRFAAAAAELPARVLIGAMGPGTAEAWRQTSRQPDFVGDGDPAGVAQAFRQATPRGARVAFAQAADSRRSVERALGDHLVALPWIVYRSTPDLAAVVDPADVFLLTSPLNAGAALRAHTPATAPELWVLGPTTATWCAERGYRTAIWTPPAGR